MELLLVTMLVLEMLAILYLNKQYKLLKEEMEYSKEVSRMQQETIENLRVHEKHSLEGKILKMQRDGESIKTIAKKLGISATQVGLHLKPKDSTDANTP